MEERITAKIEEIIDYIISKPARTITLNDYTILHEEIKDIRFRRSQAESSDRIRQLVAAGFPDAVFNSGD